MKNKLGFIMPRLIGATVIAGIAALVITTLFKLLVGITLLAAAVTLIARSIGRRQKLLGQYGQEAMPGFRQWNVYSKGDAGINPIQPVRGYRAQKGTSVVPVN